MIEIADSTGLNTKRIYFGGDSAHGRHYKAIAQEFPAIDIALLPIGPCEPRRWMKLSHLSPEEAGQAFLELGARHLLPMHGATYWFGIDTPLMPIERLQTWWSNNKEQLAHGILHVMKIGETRSFASEPRMSHEQLGQCKDPDVAPN